MSIALVTSRLRVEEKLILSELERRGVPFDHVDDGALVVRLEQRAIESDLVWNRSLSFGRALYLSRALEAQGVRVLNRASVVATCGDKFQTSLALQTAGVPNLRTRIAFTVESALLAIEELGYPVVLKPLVGSWGRLVARIDNRNAAEAVLESRAELPSWQHQIFYIQEYVEKPGRDLRVFTVGEQAIAGIYRESAHWITNTARGSKVRRCEVSGEVGEIALAASRAVGGGLLAIDLAETPQGLAVIEVNHSGEFRNSIEPTGVDLVGAMVDYALSESVRVRM